MAGKLYIVATPIGNLEDLTFRALRVLKEVDLILCEDTRVTKKLLDHYEVFVPTMSYHQHSGPVKAEKIIEELTQGRNIALVTDAGTPGVSDPGGLLVSRVISQFGDEAVIEAIPGPSAVTAAISVSGLAMDKFCFLGFLPHKKGRQTLIAKIMDSDYPVVLFESVHRIAKLLGELNGLGERQLVIGRELTKKFETIYRGTLAEVSLKLKPTEIKGEFVVIIEGKK